MALASKAARFAACSVRIGAWAKVGLQRRTLERLGCPLEILRSRSFDVIAIRHCVKLKVAAVELRRLFDNQQEKRRKEESEQSQVRRNSMPAIPIVTAFSR